MIRTHSLFRGRLTRAAKVTAILILVCTMLAPAKPGAEAFAQAQPSPQAAQGQMPSGPDQDLFGIVTRDPFYEWNTDPVKYPTAANKTALEEEAKELQALGAKWVRMEFFADYDGSVAPGDINWAKYDYFINDLAPKYGLKVLALLNVGMVSYNGKTVRTVAFNDPPDGGGTDPNDGSNHFIRVFTARAQEIAARYGTAISAYEVINEPNISYDMWVDSHLKGAEIKPDRYSALLASAYRAIKGVSPQAEVITGGIMIGSPPEGKDHDEFDYLFQMYVSQWTERYRQSDLPKRPGWNTVPWDGVAMHPYFLETGQLFTILKDFTRKLRDRDDYHSKLWITEIGAEAPPPDGPQSTPTAAEVNQAGYLRALYSGILNDPELKANVAHVFWFKYEDFVPGDYTHNYGLVRLAENDAHNNYATSGKVWVHKLAYRVYQELAFGHAITDPLTGDEITASQEYFSETGQAIAPEFVDYWRNNGDLGRFGYPISRPTILNGYLSQFFERAVFEYHPEYAGSPNVVLLRLVGDEYARGLNMAFSLADEGTLAPDHFYFPQTGHSLGGPFLHYWQQNGGLAIYGYPISEEITEVSPTDGQAYTVQYFERNRFEYHPEAAGTPFEVQLGLLGANLLKQDLWWR